MTLYELTNKYGDSLLSRNFAGISVALFYDREHEETFVHYDDVREGISYTLNPPKFLALDCYTHPNVYARAEMLGISNPNRLVPAEVPTHA